MDNNLKTEFKDFISTLTTDICKGVLLEDLKAINDSFNETSINYKTISTNYANNIKDIKEQFTQFQTTNKKLDGFVSNVDANNDRVNKALNIIEGSHKKVIDNIIVDNKKSFDEYSKSVQSLNVNERKQFISELTSSININSKNHMAELKDALDGSEIKAILNDINKVSNNINSMTNKMNSVESQIKEIKNSLNNAEKRIAEENSKKIMNLENHLSNKINELNNNNIGKIDNITKELSKKNNIIIVLITICIFLSFIK
jgi:archaellum component FlaC